ncbi:histone-lysine N-methyltransferase SETD1B isoform X1 [Drosophila navojoa]|uniref:histone-lysine N-methyltransferase SETD1B isoform X1 n=1 Tax=Drosophila navojoa TaxID=7232 RepID=UPI0011BF1B1E|nr:histone-lysine N-methyltransferase SETD1B isoform X1 [Drosophila navojoa]
MSQTTTSTATKSEMSKTNEAFDEELFETRLEALKDTQECIQQMSSWCLQHRINHKKIIQCWLNVFKRVRVDHRLVLFYLANDVIQYSKRKRYEFVECWATALQRATTMVRDERVKSKILRIFKIWEQREIYNEEFLSDLSGLLNIAPPKKAPASADPSNEYQNATLIAQVRECVELAETTDKSMKKLPKPPNFEIEAIKQQLKDKSHSGDIEKEVERCVAFINAYNKNLQNEIKSRKAVLESIEAAKKFYEHQGREVKVVASAYKSFGTRIKIVKRKLDEVIPTLSSPIPSPDINAPSPERDADLQLPDENNSPLGVNKAILGNLLYSSSGFYVPQNLFSGSGLNGFASYLDGGQLPFDINDFKRESSGKDRGSAIEVIGSRSDDESYTPGSNYYKPEPLSRSYSNTNANGNGGSVIPGLGGSGNGGGSGGSSDEYNPSQGVSAYGGVLPPPAPPIFGGPAQEYAPPPPPHLGYGPSDSQYTPAPLSTNPMAPPPPMPAAITASGSVDDFNSTWDMSMTWTPHDTSLNSSGASSSYTAPTQSTPHSPPHFERKGSSAPIEYSEHHNVSALGAQDVDHRTIQLPPAFNFRAKSALSDEQTRQLVDIDHRNLISLTGSPGGADKDFGVGDVDYRKAPKTEEAGSAIRSLGNNSPMMAPPGSYVKKTSSPQKSNASSSSESDRVDSSARYDPADMVVDMDMSDEDLEESQIELNANAEQLHLDNADGELDANGALTPRPVLLETPQDFQWDANNSFLTAPGAGNMQDMQQQADAQQQMQQPPPLPPQQQPWNQMQPPMPWNGNEGNNGAAGVPPPPRPPFTGGPFSFQPFGNSPDNMSRGRGRGRGWSGPYRPNYQRMPGPFDGGPGPGPRPFFQRGGGPMRNNGGRGRMRGKPWM